MKRTMMFIVKIHCACISSCILNVNTSVRRTPAYQGSIGHLYQLILNTMWHWISLNDEDIRNSHVDGYLTKNKGLKVANFSIFFSRLIFRTLKVRFVPKHFRTSNFSLLETLEWAEKNEFGLIGFFSQAKSKSQRS